MKSKSMKVKLVKMVAFSGLSAGCAVSIGYAEEPFAGTEHLERDKQVVCSAVIPADAEITGSLHLCKSGQVKETYACLDLKSESGKYRLMFRGGVTPALITGIKNDGRTAETLWSKKDTQQQVACDLPVAESIPAESEFKGAGVCSGESGETLPCMVYRYKGYRQTSIIDYMILYNFDGSKVHGIVPVHIGDNHEAMTAELAYQLGLSLIGSECCSERGKKYVEYAYQLFPRSDVYLKTYQQLKPAEQIQIMTTKNNNAQE